ncbi:phage tail protein [Paracidovorax avenae]|uniref:phage tail protein n=1 Tax=Paracidovorax avenae TaxID=80867 RepID=UPI0006B32906|nr:tail fiber protein [Paracidovorax avenae]AVS62899.1 phage tail protein [Paracidovorax avenae]
MATEPYIGEISMFAGSYAPAGWAICNGQLLPISQNQALFAILGTTYGGNGVTTFALPDLRGRVVVGPGQGPGLQPYSLGQTGGQENVTLNISQMPAHNHVVQMNVNNSAGNSATPGGRYLAASDQRNNQYADQAGGGTLAGTVVNIAGGSMPHENIQPYLCINFIIALQGVFPSRN